MGGRECHYKRDYFTKAEAIAAARDGARRNRSTKQLTPYKCPTCRFFHLTHNPEKENRKDRNARTD